MSLSFTLKQLRFTFELQAGQTFPGTSSRTLRVSGLRASVTAESLGQIYGTCTVRIFGMAQADMNKLPFFTYNPLNVGTTPTDMRVETNDGTGWFTLFKGQIVEAGPDYSAAPDVALTVLARSLYFQALETAAPLSYPGTVQVSAIVADIAAGMGRQFENNGVDGTITDAYLPGTRCDQLTAVTSQAQPRISWYDDAASNTIALCPILQPRAGQAFRVSGETGMVGYPTYDNVGPTVEIMYNPAVRIGSAVNIQSDFTFANGSWTVYNIVTEVSGETPGGPWFSKLKCARHAVGGIAQ